MASQHTHATNKSAPPYAERFPDVSSGLETEDGIARMFGELECEVCGRKTEWAT